MAYSLLKSAKSKLASYMGDYIHLYAFLIKKAGLSMLQGREGPLTEAVDTGIVTAKQERANSCIMLCFKCFFGKAAIDSLTLALRIG